MDGEAHAAVRSHWITAPAEIEAFSRHWSDLADRTGADAFLRPPWFKSWSEAHTPKPDLEVHLLFAGSELVGVLPFAIERVWVGPMLIRIARIAGVDRNTIILRLPVEIDWREDILKRSIEYLVAGGKADILSLSPVSWRSDLMSAANSDIVPPRVERHRSPDGQHIVFDLPGTFEGHLSKMSKKRRAQFRRDQRALEQDWGMTSAEEIATTESMASFIQFHTQQWLPTGRGGHFEDWPESSEIHRRFAGTANASAQCVLYHLEGKTGRLSTQLAFISGENCHWRLPARALDHDLEKFSIGKVGLLLMLEALIRRGVRVVEAGRGEYDYKLSCGGEEVPLEQLYFIRSGALPRMRMRVFGLWSRLLNLAYYRIWFLKLRPRLIQKFGLRPRSLWRAWIVSRL